MHPLSGALPLLYAPARVTRGALVDHRHSFAPPPFRTYHYCSTFVPHWKDHGDPLFDGIRLSSFIAETIFSCCRNLLFLSIISYFSSFHMLVVWGRGLRMDSVLTLLTLPC